MVLATWNAFILPIELAFEPEVSKSTANTVLNALIDLTFFLDMLIVFRTVTIGLDGALETDQKAIALKYLKGNFTIDFLSTIPLDSLAGLFFNE